MQVSNCCGAMIDDMDICGKCLEHCEAVTDWLEEIEHERKRQIEKGFTAEHDDEHKDGFLRKAALHLIRVSGAKEDLIEAAAFIVAELERLERL